MPITGAGTALMRRLVGLKYYHVLSGGAADVTDAPITVGLSAIPVADETGFTAADPVLVNGSDGLELAILGAPAAGSLPVTRPLGLAQDTGADVFEAVLRNLGKLAQGQTAINISRSLQAVFDEIGDLPIAHIESPVELGLSLGLYEHDGLNLLLALGYADAEAGAGTAADPYRVVIGAEGQTLSPLGVMRAQTIRHDGRFTDIDLLDAKFEVSGSIPLNKQNPSFIPVTVKATKMITRQWI